MDKKKISVYCPKCLKEIIRPELDTCLHCGWYSGMYGFKTALKRIKKAV